MSTSSETYRLTRSADGLSPFYFTTSQHLAASRARSEARASGMPVYMHGPADFRPRLYLPELANNQRWWYVVFCPQCGGQMAADIRSKTCRACWNPRNSAPHMAAFNAMSEAKRKK